MAERKFECESFKRTMNREAQISIALGAAEMVDMTCETAIYAMAPYVPGGPLVRDIYTFTKAVGVSVSEARVDNKGLAHVGRGILKGVIGVAQHHVSDVYNKQAVVGDHKATISGALMGTLKKKDSVSLLSTVKEAAVWSGLQGVVGGVGAYEQGKGAGGIAWGATKATGLKATAFGIAKGSGRAINAAAQSNFLNKALPEYAQAHGLDKLGALGPKVAGVLGSEKMKMAPTVISKTVMNIPKYWEAGSTIMEGFKRLNTNYDW